MLNIVLIDEGWTRRRGYQKQQQKRHKHCAGVVEHGVQFMSA